MDKQYPMLTISVMIIVSSLNLASSPDFQLWNVRAGLENELLWTYTVRGFLKYIRSAAISSNGEYIVAGSDDGVYFFRYEENVPIWRYTIDVSSVAISSDGKYIATGGSDGVYLFRDEDNVPIWKYGGDFSSVALSSDGEYLAAGGRDGVYLFRGLDNVLIWKYAIDYITGMTIEVAISSNGKYVGTKVSYPGAVFLLENVLNSSRLDIINLFNNVDNVPLWTYETTQKSTRPMLSSNGSYVAIGDGSTVKLFGREDNVPIWEYVAGDFIRSVALALDGEYIVAGGDDKKISLLRREENAPLWTYATIDPDPLSGRIISTAISSNGEYLVATEGLYHLGEVTHVYFFDRNDNITLWTYSMPNDIDPFLVVISSDGGYVVVLGRDVGKGVVEGGIMYLFGKVPLAAWQLVETWAGTVEAPFAANPAPTVWPSALSLIVILVLGIGGIALIIIKKSS
jgi:WD40 repeat protein